MAQVNLTPGKIQAFQCPPDKGQVFLWDKKQAGLGVRATPRSKTFVYQDRVGGSKGKVITFRLTIGPASGLTIDMAREIAASHAYQVSKGKDPRLVLQAEQDNQRAKRAEMNRQEVTLAELWPVYIEANKHRWSPRHLADHERMVQTGGEKARRGQHIIQAGPLVPLLPLKLPELTPETVTAWAVAEAAKRATQTRIAFDALRACLNWADDNSEYQGLIHPGACSSRVKRQAIPRKKAKNDCLQREQLPAWFAAMRQIGSPVISAYLQALLLTGARREELAALKWTDLDFMWKSITIHDKVEGLRTIPLTPYVAYLLAPLPRRNEYVFSSPAAKSGRLQEPRHPHNKALATTGIENLTLHGLRRSFGTLSEWVEVPAGVVAQIMGHKPSATAEKHYRRRPLDLLRMWHTKVEAWILGEAGIEQPTDEQTTDLRVLKTV